MPPDPTSGRASRARYGWPDHYKFARSGPGVYTLEAQEATAKGVYRLLHAIYYRS